MLTFAHLAIFVNNLDVMEHFYQEIFSMKTVWKNPNDKAYLTTGNNDIFALVQNKKQVQKETPLDAGIIANAMHFGVIVDNEEEFALLLKTIQEKGIRIAGPKESRDNTKSFYLLDPEKNPVQVIFASKEYFQ